MVKPLFWAPACTLRYRSTYVVCTDNSVVSYQYLHGSFLMHTAKQFTASCHCTGVSAFLADFFSLFVQISVLNNLRLQN
jgi:hypothetical protein